MEVCLLSFLFLLYRPYLMYGSLDRYLPRSAELRNSSVAAFPIPTRQVDPPPSLSSASSPHLLEKLGHRESRKEGTCHACARLERMEGGKRSGGHLATMGNAMAPFEKWRLYLDDPLMDRRRPRHEPIVQVRRANSATKTRTKLATSTVHSRLL